MSEDSRRGSDDRRCHDDRCGVREQCSRWVLREEGGVQVMHAMTLKHGCIPHELPCAEAIGEFPDEEVQTE